jgi:hypothetical protein
VATFRFDGDPTIEHHRCDGCGSTHETSTGFVLLDDHAHAVYYADWDPHGAEAFIDVVMGTWQEPDYPDQVTFGCRIGLVAGQREPAASLVAAGSGRPEHPMFGVKLVRGAALDHPNLAVFWDTVDWLVVNDPLLHRTVYHLPASD